MAFNRYVLDLCQVNNVLSEGLMETVATEELRQAAVYLDKMEANLREIREVLEIRQREGSLQG
jgi:hypothetical protein